MNNKLKQFFLVIALVALMVFAFASSVANGQGATLWKLVGGNTLQPNVSTWGLTVPSLNSSGTKCLQVNASGVISANASACGGGGGGGGDMSTSTYDPASIAEQLVGLTATQTLTNKTLTAPVINTPTVGTSLTGSYLTASEMLITDGSKKIISAPVSTYPSLTELTYLKGVTSAVQTQLNGKQGSITGGDTQITFFDGANTPAGDSGLVYNKTTDTLTILGNLELGHATANTLSASGGVLSIEGLVIPTVSSTNTITNKRNQPRIVSASSYTTDTGTSLDVSTTDIFVITAQAGALLFNNPSGTPVQGEKLIIRIKDNGTARALTYGSQFRASSDLALPTTTVLGKTLYMGFIYNSTDTKWDLIAVLNNI